MNVHARVHDFALLKVNHNANLESSNTNTITTILDHVWHGLPIALDTIL